MERAFTFATRLTLDIEGKGPHLNYPFGLFQTHRYFGERHEIERGRWPIVLQFDSPRKGEAAILQTNGEPMYAFVPLMEVSPEYDVFKFWNWGKQYQLEIRIVEFHD